MKKLILAAIAVVVGTLTGCQSPVNKPVTPCPAQEEASRLFLPSEIYAVPGVETNIYFANAFLCLNPANYAFDVTCQVGRHDLKRWRYTPRAQDANKSFPLTLTVADEHGVIAQAKTVIKVAAPQAGAGTKLTVLMIGDSLTDATVYPTRVHALMQGKNNPQFKMLGSHCGGGRAVKTGGVAHEGYGGWTWQRFLTHYQEKLPASASAKAKLYAHSPFLFKVNGAVKMDLPRYFARVNGGKAPDVITIQLGVNDVFGATAANRSAKISAILQNADKLLAQLRAAAPQAVIGVGYVTPGSGQDSFGNNYKCGQTAWGYRQNVFYLNRAMFEHFAPRCNAQFALVPVVVNLDCENNFPTRREAINQGNKNKVIRQRNGVHPAPAGYNQIGDTYYAWLKYLLSQPNGVEK